MSSSYHVTERKCDEPQGAEQRTFSDPLRNWGCDWLEIDLFFDHVFAQTTSCRQCGHTLCTACVTAGYHDMSHWSLLFLLLVCSCHAVGPARHCDVRVASYMKCWCHRTRGQPSCEHLLKTTLSARLGHDRWRAEQSQLYQNTPCRAENTAMSFQLSGICTEKQLELIYFRIFRQRQVTKIIL